MHLPSDSCTADALTLGFVVLFWVAACLMTPTAEPPMVFNSLQHLFVMFQVWSLSQWGWYILYSSRKSSGTIFTNKIQQVGGHDSFSLIIHIRLEFTLYVCIVSMKFSFLCLYVHPVINYHHDCQHPNTFICATSVYSSEEPRQEKNTSVYSP